MNANIISIIVLLILIGLSLVFFACRQYKDGSLESKKLDAASMDMGRENARNLYGDNTR